MLDPNIAIEFRNVGKQYRLGRVGTGTIQHDLNRWFQTSILGKEDPYLKIGEVNDRSKKGNSDYVWALKDINFKVEQGDVVGIIGKNGAGKSTLLKLLSHITAPSTGDIFYRGRIASLLEVGTGFHPEMTARENIYMNGSIMGMTRAEITRKLDEIIDFAGVERYIDTPVKRFSSGMTVRLGFAVAAFLEPEILVVDEVLAVGDAEFQKKAIGKMQDISSGNGRTVLFVSHNMGSIRQLCTKGILLENGQLSFSGTQVETINEYMKFNLGEDNSEDLGDMPRIGKCSGKVKCIGINYYNEFGQEIIPHCGQYVKIRFKLNVQDGGVDRCYISTAILDMYGDKLMTFPSNTSIDDFHLNEGIQFVDCVIPKLPLTEGRYIIGAWISSDGECHDNFDSRNAFVVEDDLFYSSGRQISAHMKGKVVLCEHSWHVN